MNEHQLAAFGLPLRPMHSGSTRSAQLTASRNAAHRSGLLQAVRAHRLALKAKLASRKVQHRLAVPLLPDVAETVRPSRRPVSGGALDHHQPLTG